MTIFIFLALMLNLFGTKKSALHDRVAELTRITLETISKLTARLLEKELVILEEHSDDRRYQNIKLTKKTISTFPIK